ncbi:MAG: 3-isopropylmalate dehydrogenase [Crocinitomicaceae bacterium]
MKYKIAVIKGDGIGPEIIKEAIKVLDAVSNSTDLTFDYRYVAMGGESIEKCGEAITDEAIATCKDSDAVLFGAIGDPKYDNDPSVKVRPEQGLLKLRKELGLYANVRPIKAYKQLIEKSPLKSAIIEKVDMVIYRELTGGIYFGNKGTNEDESFAWDTCEYEVTEIYRILKLAFKAAQSRSKKLTLIDKANVMETSRLWRKMAQEMSTDYEDVELNFLFVDNAAMQMILNPSQFDVIATSNMFGDIISDEASVIAGSLGLLPSASIGVQSALFEPIHGSYPQAKGLGVANPVGTILSAAMMLRHLGYPELEKVIQQAVSLSFDKGVVGKDLVESNYSSTQQIGNFISEYVASHVNIPMISAYGEI